MAAPDELPSTERTALTASLALLGGAAAGWFLCVYGQGHYHLYQGFGKNEYFEPAGGLAYFSLPMVPWIGLGAGLSLGLVALIAAAMSSRQAQRWRRAFCTLQWLGVPAATLAVHPLLGAAGLPATLLAVFHGILALGLTLGLIAWSLFDQPEEGRRAERTCRALLVLFMVVHFALLAWFNVRQLQALNLGYSDSGRTAESLNQTLRGNFMMTYNQGYADHLGPGTSMEHLFWTRVLMVPLYWLFPYHETLLVMQALALSLGALPVYLLARGVMKSPSFGLVFALAYLLYPPLLYINFRSSYGPGEEAQGLLFLLAACCCLSRGRMGWCVVWCVLTVAVKENFAPMTATLGLFMILDRSSRRVGVGLLAGSVAYFLIGTKFILPLFSDGGSQFIVNYYQPLGASFSEIAWKMLTRPHLVMARIAEYRNLSFVMHLLVPLAALSLFSPLRLCVLLPSLVFLLLSGNPMHHSILFWNHSILVPILFFSAIHGADRLRRLATVKHGSRDPLIGLAATALVCSGLSCHLFFFRMLTPATFRVTPRAALVKELRSLIPGESSVFATYRLASHFTDYGALYVISRYLPTDQDYLAFDAQDRFVTYSRTLEARDAALRNPEYGLVYHKSDFLVFKRGAPREGLWKDILLEERPKVDSPVNQVQHGTISLVGWNALRPVDRRSVFLETFWECLEPPGQEYEVMVYFRLPSGETITSRHLMASWLYPTTLWRKGELVRDVARIEFEGEIPRDFRMAVRLVEWDRR